MTMDRDRSIKLAPGFLVGLSVRLVGGVTYVKSESETQSEGPTQVKRWKTERTVIDVEEHERGRRLRGALRHLIARVGVPTPFGLVCPESSTADLDAAVADARAQAAEYTAGATHSKLEVHTLRAEIAKDEAESVASIRSEIIALVAEMQAAAGAGNVADLRDTANKARQMSRLLEQQTTARTTLEKAVVAARRAARQLVKRVEKDGEDLARVIADQNLQPIAAARFAFDPNILEPPAEETGQADIADVELGGLPDTRFVGVAEEADALAEPASSEDEVREAPDDAPGLAWPASDTLITFGDEEPETSGESLT